MYSIRKRTVALKILGNALPIMKSTEYTEIIQYIPLKGGGTWLIPVICNIQSLKFFSEFLKQNFTCILYVEENM